MYEEALEDIGLGKRLSPHDIYMWAFLHNEAMALFALKRYEEAENIARLSIKERSSNAIAHVVLIAALAAQDRDGEAEAAYRGMIGNKVPKPTKYMVESLFSRDAGAIEKMLTGLRRSGWKG